MRGERGISIAVHTRKRIEQAGGYAHSVETWRGRELVGGLYGVALGTAFCGESMFARRPDASKVAMATLLANLRSWGFRFVDCQVHTEHLERFGAQEWPRALFLRALREALHEPTRRGPWTLDLHGPAALAALPNPSRTTLGDQQRRS